jgi:hypothetical protein
MAIHYNRWHGTAIIVNADREDWAKKKGVVPQGTPGCWCYHCWLEKTGGWSAQYRPNTE